MNTDANINSQGITDIAASLNVDDSQNRISISNHSDENSSQQEEITSSSEELARPSREVQLVPTVGSNWNIDT